MVAVALLPAFLVAADAPAAVPPKAAPRCLALLIGGTPGTPMNARLYADWLGRFRAILNGSGTAAADLVLLTPQANLPGRTGDATAAAGQDAIASLAKRAAPQDQFVLILIGHGQPDGSLALPGPDLTPAKLAEALKLMPAERQIVLDFTSCAGAAIPTLAKPGRIIIAANGETEDADSEFAEFFLLVQEGAIINSADAPVSTGKRATPSLLEAYNTACHEYGQWITRQHQPEGATGWIVDGRRTREIFRKLYGADDVPAPKRMMPDKGDDKDDELMPLTPGDKPNQGLWAGRRLPNGHPLLEDTGKSDGAVALGSDGFQSVTGNNEGGVGLLAKPTVLGRPGVAVP